MESNIMKGTIIDLIGTTPLEPTKVINGEQLIKVFDGRKIKEK